MATNFKGVDDVRNPIARVLGRVLIPALLQLLLLALPATGRHRCGPYRRSRPVPRSRPRRILARRSPYARDREQVALLDGAGSPPGRSCPTDHFLAASQRRRRQALWAATVGVDIDLRDIHAVGAVR